MMEVEPKSLAFRDVFLNQAYTSSVIITNPLTAPVEFTLRPSSPRYTVTPNRVNLSGGQSIVITVRLFLSHYPNFRQGLRGQDDTIHIKSSYFEQKVDVAFFLHSRDSTTTASRSRSSSPMRPGFAGSSSTDSLAELQKQVHSRDSKISQLETIISQLESKYPSVQEIVRNRIEQERVVFEEKSEKALALLERKDKEIGYLQGQLAESSSTIARLLEQKATETSATRNVDADVAQSNLALRESNSVLETALKDATSKLRSEEVAHTECKERMEGALRELEHVRESYRQAQNNVQHEHQYQELRGLRERTMDQAEQIDVLVTEIAKLRNESHNSGSLVLAQEEISRLQSEAKQLKSRIESLKQENTSLQMTVEHLNSALTSAVASKSPPAISSEAPAEADAGLFRSPARPPKAGHVSWGGFAVDAQLDPSAGGTPIPSHFNGRSVDDMSHILQERTAQVRLYQERADKVENENDILRSRLSEARDVENELRIRLRDFETRSAEHQTELKVLLERIERHRRERDEFQMKSDDKEMQLKSAVEKLEMGSSKNREKDAHVWWSYVWHELKRQHADELAIKDGVGKFECSQGEDAMVKLSSLKANLSAQAIEIASLRQELLGRKLSYRTEVESLKEQLDLANRESLRLNSLIRTHRGDKETRLAEMAATIRSLSARSDIHLQLAAARQELEAEKVATHHLRADIDSYRNMIEVEHNKCALLRKELNLLQGQIDASVVMRTVTGVPGVEPAVLIETMSGKIIALHAEMSKCKNALTQAQTQINNLLRVAATEKKRIVAPGASVPDGAPANKRAAAQITYPNLAPSIAQEQHVAASSQSQNLTFDAEQDTSFIESFSQPSIGAFSLMIDGECTPQQVLECLEMSTLAHKVQLQESYIADLLAEISKLSQSALQAEGARLADRDHYEDAYRIDAESSSQKFELLQVSLDEAKVEISTLREENSLLQKALSDAQIDSVTTISLSGGANRNYPSEWEANVGDSVSSTFFDSDELREEFERTKLILRERTTELKIVMETLDALHVAGVKEKTGNENIFVSDNINGQGDLASLANTPLPSIEGSWGIQSLVKRVVELTTELTSQCATAALEERRANKFDEETKRIHRELNKQRNLLRLSEESQAKLQSQIAILSDRVKESEKLRVELTSSNRHEFDSLLSALRDSETKVSTAEVTINELRQQALLADKDGFKEWIEHVITDGSIASTLYESHPKDDNDECSVRKMVANLLKDWKEHVASYPQRSPKPGASISKSEQRFLQRVADLVMDAYRQSNAAVVGTRRAELRCEHAERASQVTKEKLQTALLHLHRYRKRSIALQKIVRSDSRCEVSKGEKVTSLVRKALIEERRKYSECFNTLLAERRQNKINEINRAFDAKKMLSMQHRIAELECQGTAAIRGREEASYSLDSKIKMSEESMHRWFKTELPRMISGLPLTEDSMGFDLSSNLASESDYLSGLGVKNQSVAGLGLDRTFALAQALCCAKASATTQDMKLLGALERNSLLKTRVIELEGVLSRWKSDIDTVVEKAASSRLEEFNPIGAEQAVVNQTTDNYLDRIQQLTARMLEVEEENIVSAGRLDHAVERNDEMKGLLDIMMKEEELLKDKMTKQLAKMSQNYEMAHAAELRNIREIYESEKKELTNELEKVLGAVDFARATVESVPSQTRLATREHDIIQASESESDSLDECHKPPQESFTVKPAATSVMMSVVDATDDVSNRIRSLLAQLSSSNRITPPFQANANISDAQVDQSNILELQSEIASLQAALETERVRSREARAEVSELEQLLTAQRAAFSDRLHGAIDMGSPLQGHCAKSSTGTSNSISSPADAMSIHEHNYTAATLDMDAHLWPTLGSLLDELTNSLNHLSARYKNLTDDSYLRTALAMVARLKRVLSQGSDGFNIATPVIDQESPQSEHGSPSTACHTRDLETPSLQSLLDQVQVLENKFATDRQPEKNIYLLRDLRLRVTELESFMSRNFDRQKESWDRERSALLQSLEDSSATIDNLRSSQAESAAGIRARYEEILKQTQEALEQQTDAATEQIRRLDELCRNTQMQNEQMRERLGESESARASLHEQNTRLHSESEVDRARLLEQTALLRAESESALMHTQDQIASLTQEIERLNFKVVQVETTPVISAPLPRPPSPVRSQAVTANSSAQLVGSSLEELLKLQRLLERANDDLEASHRRTRILEEKHAKDIGILRDQCAKLKRDLDASIKAPKSQNSDNAHARSKNRVASADERTQELEDQLRKIEYRFRSKSAELEAIVRSLSKAGNTTESSIIFGGDSIDDDNSSMPSNADMPSIPPVIRCQLVEARLQTAENEVQSLQQLLSKEKKDAIQKARLQKLVAGGTGASVQVKEKDLAAPGSPPRPKTPLRSKDQQKSATPVRSPRRNIEVKRNEFISVVEMAEKESALNDEINSLKLQLSESRLQIQSLREELSRKTKLVTSLKAARQAESTAADHWRVEAQAGEENTKRFSRAVASKDAIIKDLRAKLETQAEEAERDAANQPQYSAIDAAPPADFKARLKAAETERLRMRSKLSVMRDRLTEADSDVKELKEENMKLAKSSEMCETLRNSLARKEAQIRSIKSRLEAHQSESQEALQESEKRIKQLLRQLEILDRSYKDLEDNYAETRKSRPPVASFPIVRSDASEGMALGSSARVETFQQLSSAAREAHPPTLQPSHRAVPSSLGSAASNDLEYVMSSLGLKEM